MAAFRRQSPKITISSPTVLSQVICFSSAGKGQRLTMALRFPRLRACKTQPAPHVPLSRHQNKQKYCPQPQGPHVLVVDRPKGNLALRHSPVVHHKANGKHGLADGLGPDTGPLQLALLL